EQIVEDERRDEPVERPAEDAANRNQQVELGETRHGWSPRGEAAMANDARQEQEEHVRADDQPRGTTDVGERDRYQERSDERGRSREERGTDDLPLRERDD